MLKRLSIYAQLLILLFLIMVDSTFDAQLLPFLLNGSWYGIALGIFLCFVLGITTVEVFFAVFNSVTHKISSILKKDRQ